MTSRGARVGAAARYLACFGLVAGGVILVAGIIADSAIARANGVLLIVTVMLLVGVTYSAVFAREAQLARRQTSRRR